MNKGLQFITELTGILTQANIAVPIVVGAVLALRAIWNRQNPENPLTDMEVINAMDAKFQEVGLNADAEIARLRAELDRG